MRKVQHQLDSVKNHVRMLAGKNLRIIINKGRKKIFNYHGCIDEVFPQIFTFKVTDSSYINKLSFSYSDIICGEIELKEVGS